MNLKDQIKSYKGRKAKQICKNLGGDSLTSGVDVFIYNQGFDDALELGSLIGRNQLFAAILNQGFKEETQDWIRSRAVHESDYLCAFLEGKDES